MSPTYVASPDPRVKLERFTMFGDTRYRYWVRASVLPGYAVSNGGAYRTIAEAVAAGVAALED